MAAPYPTNTHCRGFITRVEINAPILPQRRRESDEARRTGLFPSTIRRLATISRNTNETPITSKRPREAQGRHRARRNGVLESLATAASLRFATF